ncbi:MAG: SusC/RagA family TonB-linked outer membrane protein [Prolixibacteraceae bacterium]
MQKIKNIPSNFTLLCLVLLLIAVIPVSSSALNLLARHSLGDGGDLNDYTIEFSSRELRLKQALDELLLHKEFNIVYGGKEIAVEVPIVFTSRTLKLSEALKQIEKQAPVEFIISDKHIIVKSRMLEMNYHLTGKVVDKISLQGLVAANVIIGGTNTGVVTDNNGYFSLSMPPGTYSIIARYLGYKLKTQNVNLYQDINLNIALDIEEQEIQSVNVTGNYSVIENIQTGRTIETIDSKVIDRLNTNDVNDALHGRVNGVWNTKVSGAPGDHHKIRIRGISSIFGSTDPLYVVDGAIIPIVNFENLGISDLNAHDIESITVLKDASSTALYGNLGGNGVILIETKKGGGPTSYQFSVKQGLQRFDKRYDLMGAEDFLNTLQLSDDLIHSQFYTVIPSEYNPKYELYPRYRDSLGNALVERDYQEELFRMGHINEYQLSGAGNYKTVDYYLSGNYYNHQGVIVNTAYRKYSFTANLSKVVKDKYSLRFMYKSSHQENKNTLDNYLGNNVIFKGINYEPAYESTPDSFLAKPYRLYNNTYESPSISKLANGRLSPETLFYDNDKIKKDNGNTFNLQAFYQLNSTVSARLISSYSMRNLTFTSLNTPTYYTRQQFLKSSENYVYFNTQLDLNYQRQFKNHQISALVRYRAYRDKVVWQVDSMQSVTYDGIRPEDEIYLRGSQAIYGERGAVIRSIHSGIVNLNYNYRKKYFVSFISNYEMLIEGQFLHKGESYNSLAINYDLSREELLHLPKWVDAFNLYMNTGVSGNYPLNSLSDNLFSTNATYTIADSIVRAAYISNLANKYLRPEKVKEINYGLKLALFQERIFFSADYYRKINTDLLIKRTIPLYYGGGFFFQNIGEMKNSGYELSLEIIPFQRENLYWSSKFGFSTNRQFITKLYDGVPITFNNTDILIPDFVAVENEPLGAINGYEYVSRWADIYNPENKRIHPDYVENAGLAYARNDSVLSKSIKKTDSKVIGNSIPYFTLNWINDFEYKNFSVNMLWYGAVGLDKYNATKASTYISGSNTEVRNIVLDTLTFLRGSTVYESSYFMEDASFLRLKTLSFSYRQPRKIASKVAVEYTLSFENLITLTPYTGYDPEAAIYTNNNFTDNAIDKGAYPNPKGIYFSINLNF